MFLKVKKKWKKHISYLYPSICDPNDFCPLYIYLKADVPAQKVIEIYVGQT